MLATQTPEALVGRLGTTEKQWVRECGASGHTCRDPSRVLADLLIIPCRPMNEAPLCVAHIRANPGHGQVVMRRLSASETRAARVIDEHSVSGREAGRSGIAGAVYKPCSRNEHLKAELCGHALSASKCFRSPQSCPQTVRVSPDTVDARRKLFATPVASPRLTLSLDVGSG